MSNDTLRIIAPDKHQHGEAIFALLEKEWEGISDFGHARVSGDSHYDWCASRIGFIGDEMVTHYGVYRLAMRIGAAEIPTAGVNLVVTHPDYRKRGLMAQTAMAATAGLRDEGYQLSVLCNAIEDFYGRFGYIFGWPETDAVIELKQLPTAPPDVVAQPCSHEQQPAFAAVYNRDNRRVSGTAVRPTFPRGKHPSNGLGSLWNDVNGAVAGYVLYDIAEATHTLWIDDSGGDPEQRLRVLAQLCRQHNCEEVRFERLAPRSPLGQRLRQLSCRWEHKYLQNGGWMIQIHHLSSLCNQLVPVWDQRLHDAGLNTWRGDLLLADAHEAVVLRIDRGRVAVEPPRPTPHSLRAGAYLAQFIVGTAAPDALIANAPIKVAGDARWLLPVLFPAQEPQLSNDDL